MIHLKPFILMLLSSVCCSTGAESRKESGTNLLEEVTVWSKRPLKEIGVRKTVFDSIALKENISLSMADVLTFNSSVFVKSYGRATLSTVSFRGTSASHTKVTWNGMNIESPMLGMTDFSTIPSFFVDQASLLHGTSSVNEAGGGLGGLVKLGNTPDVLPGIRIQYIQGVGSFNTFDEFARFSYGSDKWKTSVRFAYSSSPNDYKYVNHDRKVNVYDEEMKIIGQYHPVERNRSGAFRDLNLLQEVYFDSRKGDRLGFNVWFSDSGRDLPMLTTDYGDERKFENRQHERSLRSVLHWLHQGRQWKMEIRGGLTHTNLAYDYKRETASGNWAVMTRARSYVNTLYSQIEYDGCLSDRLSATASVSAYQHFVRSKDKDILLQDGDKAIVGYDKGRSELSAAMTFRYQPIDPIGISFVVREEMIGKELAPVIPALLGEVMILREINLALKSSISRNYRHPTLNDLFFLPGGNPDLRYEHGWSYDVGLDFGINRTLPFPLSLDGGATWFDSMIDDWILWLPTTKGFFSPRNVKKVHAYGIEGHLGAGLQIGKDLQLDFHGSYSWTPSVNIGEPISIADQSIGKQLPYVPRHSASFTGRAEWKSWGFLYKWVYYSRRHTMSSNDLTLTGRLPEYFMSNISVDKALSFKSVDLQLKLAINNLFDEDYLSVLSRPMPGRNFEIFLSIQY